MNEKEQSDVDKPDDPVELADSVDSGDTEQSQQNETRSARGGRVVAVGDILNATDRNVGRLWAQGLADNSAYFENLRKALNLASGSLVNYPKNLSGPIAALDILSGSLNSPALKDFVASSALGDLSAVQLKFAEQIKGIFASTDLMRSMGALSEIRHDLGKILGGIDTPKIPTSAYEFLTTTEELRYSSNRNVWHYTSGLVLLQVLSNDLFWASAPQHLNDTSEVKHGIDIIRAAFERKMEALRGENTLSKQDQEEIENLMESKVFDDRYFDSVIKEIYFISASTDSDSLTLWRNYANGDGFAIGIDTDVELSPEGLVPDPEHENAEVRKTVPPINGWYRVHYTDRKKKKLADEFVARVVKDLVDTSLSDREKLVGELRKQTLILASTMKHNAFKDEKEVRWMTTNWMPAESGLGFVHYAYARNGIVPVLHIKTSSDETKPLPLRGVRCSPVSPDGIERTIEGLLIQRNYWGASKNVKKSQQPFRG